MSYVRLECVEEWIWVYFHIFFKFFPFLNFFTFLNMSNNHRSTPVMGGYVWRNKETDPYSGASCLPTSKYLDPTPWPLPVNNGSGNPADRNEEPRS